MKNVNAGTGVKKKCSATTMGSWEGRLKEGMNTTPAGIQNAWEVGCKIGRHGMGVATGVEGRQDEAIRHKLAGKKNNWEKVR